MKVTIHKWVWFAVVLPLLGLVYLSGVKNELVFDDFILADGTIFSEYGHLQAIKPRLLSYSTYTWILDAFGEGWWKQRAVNLAIHVGVVLALWGFYRELLKYIAPAESSAAVEGSSVSPLRDSPALGLAIGFVALNPVAVYAVSYLIQRSILLATLFVVLGLWAFLRGVSERRWLYWALATVAYVLAMASKEHAVMAPVAAAMLYILAARPTARQLAWLVGAGILLVAVAAAVLIAYYGEIVGQAFDKYSRIYLAQLATLGPDVEDNAFALSILNQTYLFFKYGFLWIVPYPGWMSIDMRPPFPISFLSFPHVLGPVGFVAVVVGGFIALIRYRDWRALIGISLLMPALLFATELSTVWIQDPFVLYRSYLWAIGMPGLVFFLFHGMPRQALIVVGVVLSALFVFAGLERVRSMSTTERVWTDVIEKLPDDPRAVGRWFPYLNRGHVYLERGLDRHAIKDFTMSSRLGDGGFGLYNIGALLYSSGQYAQSLSVLDQAAAQGYALASLDYQRGITLLALNDYTRARDAFTHAMEKKPEKNERLEILIMRARAEMELGEINQARQDLTKVLRQMPENKKAQLSMGMLHVKTGQYQLAHDLFSALLLKDTHASLFHGRAMANHGLKRKAAALADIDRALELAPTEPGFRDWREKIMAMP